MDPNVATIVQTGILAGMATIIATTVIGVKAWLRVEMAKSEAQKRPSSETLEAVESLRKEVAELRDITTRYDMSFDTALQRLESRVGQLETGQLRGQESPVYESIGAGKVTD